MLWSWICFRKSGMLFFIIFLCFFVTQWNRIISNQGYSVCLSTNDGEKYLGETRCEHIVGGTELFAVLYPHHKIILGIQIFHCFWNEPILCGRPQIIIDFFSLFFFFITRMHGKTLAMASMASMGGGRCGKFHVTN